MGEQAKRKRAAAELADRVESLEERLTDLEAWAGERTVEEATDDAAPVRRGRRKAGEAQ